MSEMPAKRRKPSQTDEDVSPSATPSAKRRKKSAFDPVDICQDLYDTIRNHKTEEGRLLCEAFIRAPKRRNDPEYYNSVTTPVDLLKIQHKLKNDEYEEIDDMTSDVKLMIDNAKAYYSESSQEHQDACQLWKLYQGTKNILIAEALGEVPDLVKMVKAQSKTTSQGEQDDESDKVTSFSDEVIGESVLDDIEGGMQDSDQDTEIYDDPLEEDEVPDYDEEDKELGDGSSFKEDEGDDCMIPLVEPDDDDIKETGSQDMLSEILVPEVPNIKPLDSYDDQEEEVKNETEEEVKKEEPKIEPRRLRERRRSDRDGSQQKEPPRKGRGRPRKSEPRSREGSVISNVEDENHCEDLFTAVYTATDNGRDLSLMFRILPSESKYPEYYSVIKEPMDLRTIARKIQRNDYRSMDEMGKDLNTMVANAKMFNEPGSQIYRDAVTLRRLITNKKIEIETPKPPTKGPKSSKRTRTRKSTPVAEEKLSAICASLEDPDAEDEDMAVAPQEVQEENGVEEEEFEYESCTEGSIADGEENEQWILFNAVKNCKDKYGMIISEPFMKLPSKRQYRDYYAEIKKPISLNQIKKNIKRGVYFNLNALASDLNLVFENAKQYNIDESILYQHAIRLQKAMLEKKGELQPEDIAEISIRSIQTPKNKRNLETSSQSSDDSFVKKKGKKALATEETLKKRLNTLYKVVFDYQLDGRRLIDIFVTIPSKKDYPDYYLVISEPIDMKTIEGKIKADKYPTEQAFISDMELMFNNARHYNEEHSQVYRDAESLERVLRNKLRVLPPLGDSPRMKAPGKNKPKTRSFDPLSQKLQDLYNSIKDHTDSRGRILSTPFMKLPLKSTQLQVPSSTHAFTPETPQSKNVKLTEEIIDQNITIEREGNKNTSYNCKLCDYKSDRRWNVLRHLYRHAKGVIEPFLPMPEGVDTSFYENQANGHPASPVVTNGFASEESGTHANTAFTKEYPDYYEVIKKAIDIQKVQQRMQASQYETLEDMVQDFVLMFDNACKYNEPDSLIYKDALTLQRICLEKKQELSADDYTNEVPDVKALVQELMMNLFISTYNHMDEDGRCFSDSFQDMPPPTQDESDPEGQNTLKKRVPSFEQVKMNLDKGRYKRLDRFQEDLFDVFEYARQVSRTDSQLYEDAVELQLFFMKIRDELCKNGEIMLTPALSYTERHLTTALEDEKKEKLPKEQKDDEEKRKLEEEGNTENEIKEQQKEGNEDTIVFNDQTYKAGDFVYLEPREKNLDPHIVCMEAMWKDDAGEAWFKGHWFYRPNETFHLASRKFLEKEVFKGDVNDSIPFSRVLGKCYVMYVKEYFKYKPENFQDKDIYVCESRYAVKQKAFKKVKIWPHSKNEDVKFVPRDNPLPKVRVASVFASKADAAEPGQSLDTDDGESILEKKREIVIMDNPSPADTNTYYEQYQIPAGWFKLGDFVYVNNNTGRPYIARLDKLWIDKHGNSFFFGPWFVYPEEIEHPPTRLFYKREVFKSSIEDTNPMLSIQGKCGVLSLKDFTTCRPTECAECDVYVCESKYIENEKAIRKLQKSMKKHSLSPKTIDDEVYYFKKPIIPEKEQSPLLLKASTEDSFVAQEDISVPVEEASMSENFSYGIGTEESEEGSMSVPSVKEVVVTPTASTKKKGKGKGRGPCAFILWAAEYRKDFHDENPELNFGEISKLAGQKWKELPPEEKKRYEEKAKKLAEENAAKQAEADKAFQESLTTYPVTASPHSPAPGRAGTPGSQQFQQGQTPQGQQMQFAQGQFQPQQGQFMQQQMMNQGIHPGMRPQTSYGLPMTPQGVGLQRQVMPPPQGSGQNQGMPPYGYHSGMQMSGGTPQLQGTPTSQGPTPLGPTVFSQSMTPLSGMTSQQQPASMVPTYNGMSSAPQGQMTPQQVMVSQPPPRPPSPMFVTVPPRTQRVLHSEAYLRYIENLSPESHKRVPDWERSLYATPENTPLSDTGKLPVSWLGQGAGHHGNTVNALWALRDMMMKDALTVERHIEFNQL